MSEPLRVRWDRTVIPSTGIGDDTIVACLDQHGHPVALFLDDEHREALGLALIDPDGEMDQADDADAMTPQQCPAGKHADWAADSDNAHACPWCEIDRLRAEFREAMDNYHGAAAEAKKLRAESESRRQAAAANAASVEVLQRQINKQASELDRLGARLNKAEAAIRAAETVKCWTNEDGRRFVFAEDLAYALGYTPTTPAAPTS